MDIRVSALHRLPFDAAKFAKGMESAADDNAKMRAILEKQYRANWDNAWIIVVEYSSHAGLDFGQFAHPMPGPSAQGAWLEQDLEPSGERRRAAFFLHYVDPQKPLWYGDQRLLFPRASEAPQSLVDLLDYCSPD